MQTSAISSATDSPVGRDVSLQNTSRSRCLPCAEPNGNDGRKLACSEPTLRWGKVEQVCCNRDTICTAMTNEQGRDAYVLMEIGPLVVSTLLQAIHRLKVCHCFTSTRLFGSILSYGLFRVWKSGPMHWKSKQGSLGIPPNLIEPIKLRRFQHLNCIPQP
jgi:hypothetical protein